jgi:hypothetical protein
MQRSYQSYGNLWNRNRFRASSFRIRSNPGRTTKNYHSYSQSLQCHSGPSTSTQQPPRTMSPLSAPSIISGPGKPNSIAAMLSDWHSGHFGVFLGITLFTQLTVQGSLHSLRFFLHYAEQSVRCAIRVSFALLPLLKRAN